MPPSSRRGWMSGVKRLASLPRSSTVTGAALRRTGDPIPRTIARSTPTRFSRSVRSPRFSPRCCLPTWWCVERSCPTIPWPNSCREACRCRSFTASPSRCSISRPIRPVCRAYLPTSSRLTRAILMPTTRSGSFTIFSPFTNYRSRPGRITNTRISASACWAMRSHCAPA